MLRLFVWSHILIKTFFILTNSVIVTAISFYGIDSGFDLSFVKINFSEISNETAF